MKAIHSVQTIFLPSTRHRPNRKSSLKQVSNTLSNACVKLVISGTAFLLSLWHLKCPAPSLYPPGPVRLQANRTGRGQGETGSSLSRLTSGCHVHGRESPEWRCDKRCECIYLSIHRPQRGVFSARYCIVRLVSKLVLVLFAFCFRSHCIVRLVSKLVLVLFAFRFRSRLITNDDSLRS